MRIYIYIYIYFKASYSNVVFIDISTCNISEAFVIPGR